MVWWPRERLTADSVQLPIFIKDVVDRFPGDAVLIARYARGDSGFCSLCEDYALALEVVRRLETSERAMVERRIADYRALMRELEGDIQRMLLDIRMRRNSGRGHLDGSRR
jgi:hypothetical protein